jgi:transcriptional regulator with XRE-family HTH domain
VSNVRERLGLSTEEFGILLGVSATTAYRWERAGYDLSRIDPFQRKLLLILEDIDPKVAAELGGKIRNATLRGGNLRGLHVVLTHFYGENP